ncbi:MAG TPA: DNA recombination protein RmuC, partial [Pseudomonadales bacterium]|nr:DNA recombination protein RmuC [Pseudomonadales bacterium]
QRQQLETFSERLKAFEAQVETAQTKQRESVDLRLTELRDSFARTGKELREEIAASLTRLGEAQQASATQMAESQKERLGAFSEQLGKLTTSLGEQLEKLREDNSKRLEEMRKTVDEKLQSTLEKRLGESFSQVSERLEAVHKGLGEMQQLASGVGDLKRVLTNVKTRGTWGEVQLGQLLGDMLTPEQYGVNVAVKPGSAERVEFAIRLPGQGDGDEPVWLPIDAKFPKEDYERLIAASEVGDVAEVEAAVKALELRVLGEAKDIASKYLAPPHTTDFGILYLPTEGLYAEITRRTGLTERIQREHRVVVAGPNTFSALLNSLQMGFRTLAIQERSGEVWKILGAVKTEFGKFGDTLEKVKKKLQEAGNHIDHVGVRSRAMQRKLRDVEALPSATSAPVLGLLGTTDGDADGALDADEADDAEDDDTAD